VPTPTSSRLAALGLAWALGCANVAAADTPVIGAPDVPAAPAKQPAAPDQNDDALFRCGRCRTSS